MRFAGRHCLAPFAAALVLLSSSAACGNDPSDAAPAGLPEPSVDSSDTRAHPVAALIERADTLSTLARALRRAGLAKELRRRGPYTLFAPTDRAFRRHWPGFDSLLTQAGALPPARSPSQTDGERAPGEGRKRARDSLRQVLQFHLARGHFATADLADALRLSTLAGKPLTLARAPRIPARLQVQDASGPVPVRRTIEAQNGVIHLLPRPLRPSPPDTSAQGALRSSGNATGVPPASVSN